MAVVRNHGYSDRTDGARLDFNYTTPNRSNAGSPNSALTPQYAGEMVLDTTNGIVYQAVGLSNTNWMPTYRY